MMVWNDIIGILAHRIPISCSSGVNSISVENDRFVPKSGRIKEMVHVKQEDESPLASLG